MNSENRKSTYRPRVLAKETYEKWEHIGKFAVKIFDDAEYNKYVK